MGHRCRQTLISCRAKASRDKPDKFAERHGGRVAATHRKCDSNHMPTFIDESGNIGITGQSPPYFRLVAACFRHDGHVDRCLGDIRELRRSLGLRATHEFRFAAINPRQKEAFFKMLSVQEFSFVSCQFQKMRVDPPTLINVGVLNETVRGLAGELVKIYSEWEDAKGEGTKLNEKLYYDECLDQRYIRAIKSEFRGMSTSEGSGEKFVRSFKSLKSKWDSRIQIADMICGAVGLHINNDDIYYKHIKYKAMGMAILPR